MSVDIYELKSGDILQHKLSKDWVMFIGLELDTITKIICRTKSLQIKKFYDFELEPKP